jgi:hypothetical protein
MQIAAMRALAAPAAVAAFGQGASRDVLLLPLALLLPGAEVVITDPLPALGAEVAAVVVVVLVPGPLAAGLAGGGPVAFDLELMLGLGLGLGLVLVLVLGLGLVLELVLRLVPELAGGAAGM